MSAVVIESGANALSMAEARDWLRLGPSEDDAAVAGLIRAAASLCEAFTGQMLIAREVTEERWVETGWMQLVRCPVAQVIDVLRLPASGPPLSVPGAEWEVIAQRGGALALRVTSAVMGEWVRIRYHAGLAENANGVPEALRQGMLRLVQHWHFSGTDDAALPAIVTALWTPWRRVSLGAQP